MSPIVLSRRSRDFGAAAGTLVALLSACSKDDPEIDPRSSLERALESRPNVDAESLSRALDSIASDPPEDAVPLIRELASDRTLPEEVRFTAVVVLGRIRDPESRATLTRIAESDPSELVRDEAKEALGGGAGGP